MTAKLKYKWVISEHYLHLTVPCGMYFTLPKVLIKVLHCQHLVNIKIIMYAVITFQTLLTCSDLHRAWLSNYTKTLKRRKMVSCSYTIHRRSPFSKEISQQHESFSSSQEADQDMNWAADIRLTDFCFPWLKDLPPQPKTGSDMYRSIGGLFA